MNRPQQDVQDVIAVVAPYWAGEAEIVSTYFRQSSVWRHDVLWLKVQACKESRPFRELPSFRQEELLRTGTMKEYSEGIAAVVRIGQEVEHFHLIAGLLREFGETPPLLTEAFQLPEDHKLQQLRAIYRAMRSELVNAAVAFTEGGGGAMFTALGQLDGGEHEQRIATIFRQIATDELAHGPREIYTIGCLAKTENDWQQVKTIVRNISRQRLLMRNEMFSFPLSPSRIQDIDNGKIPPWQFPIPLPVEELEVEKALQ